MKFKNFSFFLFCFLLLSLNSAFAHFPHDDIFQLELSPTYSQDKTIFINVRRNLFKSTDDGRNWVRLVRGLDNKFPMSSLAVSAQSADVLYASSLGDGVYKSEDAGASWIKVNSGLKDLRIDLLEVSKQADNLAIAGAIGGGAYKTSDGGKNWQRVFPDETKITAVEFFKGDQAKIIAGDNAGNLYLSGDEGNSWKKVFNCAYCGAITAIAVSPESSGKRLIYLGTEGGGIFESKDGGAVFKETDDQLIVRNIRDIKLLPAGGNKFDIVVSTWHEGVFYSKDGGENWIKYSQGLKKEFQADNPRLLLVEPDSGPRRPHFSDIRVSDGFEKDMTIFLGSFSGLFKSANAGRSWKEIDTLSRVIVGIALSPDYKNDSTLAAIGYVGEAWLSRDAGLTWRFISRFLKYVKHELQYFIAGNAEKRDYAYRLRFFDALFSPDYAKDNAIYFAPIWEPDLFRFVRGRWLKTFLTAPLGKAIAFSPDFIRDKTMYAVGQKGGVYLSKDRGLNFKKIGAIEMEWSHTSPSFVISPGFSSDRTICFARGQEGIFKTEDAGVTWRSISKATPLDGCSESQLAISPDYKSDRTLFAGTDNGVYITEDAGKNWLKLENPLLIRDGFIEALAVSPDYKNDMTLLVSIRGKGLFKSEDKGKTFSHIGDDSISLSRLNTPSASMPIQFSPAFASDRTIYGYGAAGAQIFKSTDAGNSWQVISLPEVKDNLLDLIADGYIFIKDAFPAQWLTRRSIKLGMATIFICALIFLFSKVKSGIKSKP